MPTENIQKRIDNLREFVRRQPDGYPVAVPAVIARKLGLDVPEGFADGQLKSFAAKVVKAVFDPSQSSAEPEEKPQRVPKLWPKVEDKVEAGSDSPAPAPVIGAPDESSST